MNKFLTWLLALSIPFVVGFAGCGAVGAGTQVAEAPKVEAPADPDPTVETPEVGQPEPETPALDEPTPANPEEKPYNPNRVFQLSELERIEVKIQGNPYKVWVMDTVPKMREGMMFLTEAEVGPEEGMLFVYPSEQPLSFWMRNTLLPLDIAYIRANGTVLNVAQGKPLNETGLPSSGPAQYVLEFRQGFFKRKGYGTGSKVTLPAGVEFKG